MILDKLRDGTYGSIGRVNEVILDVQQDPSLFPELIFGMVDPDPATSARAADAVEKLTRDYPDWLAPYKEFLLEEASFSERQKVCWSLALMFGRLPLNASERRHVLDILSVWLDHKGSVLRTCAMQGMADQAEQDRSLLPEVLPVIISCTDTGTPAMRARGRKLIKRLGQ